MASYLDSIARFVGHATNQLAFSPEQLQEMRKKKEFCEMVKTATLVAGVATVALTLLNLSAVSLIAGSFLAVTLYDAHVIVGNLEQYFSNPAYFHMQIPTTIQTPRDQDYAIAYQMTQNTLLLRPYFPIIYDSLK